MARWVEYGGEQWRFSQLAKAHHIAPGTLHNRLERFGTTPTGVARSLATGIMTASQAGKRGAARSPWRYRD